MKWKIWSCQQLRDSFKFVAMLLAIIFASASKIYNYILMYDAIYNSGDLFNKTE